MPKKNTIPSSSSESSDSSDPPPAGQAKLITLFEERMNIIVANWITLTRASISSTPAVRVIFSKITLIFIRNYE